MSKSSGWKIFDSINPTPPGLANLIHSLSLKFHRGLGPGDSILSPPVGYFNSPVSSRSFTHYLCVNDSKPHTRCKQKIAGQSILWSKGKINVIHCDFWLPEWDIRGILMSTSLELCVYIYLYIYCVLLY